MTTLLFCLFVLNAGFLIAIAIATLTTAQTTEETMNRVTTWMRRTLGKWPAVILCNTILLPSMIFLVLIGGDKDDE